MINWSRVYFCKPVGVAGPIKIGCTSYLEERINALMDWSPVDLELIVCIPGNLQLERKIQNLFVEAHIRKKWFHPVPDMLKGIEGLKAGVAVEHAFDLENPKARLRSKLTHKARSFRFKALYPREGDVA